MTEHHSLTELCLCEVRFCLSERTLVLFKDDRRCQVSQTHPASFVFFTSLISFHHNVTLNQTLNRNQDFTLKPKDSRGLAVCP